MVESTTLVTTAKTKAAQKKIPKSSQPKDRQGVTDGCDKLSYDFLQIQPKAERCILFTYFLTAQFHCFGCMLLLTSLLTNPIKKG